MATAIVNPAEPVDYSSTHTPSSYVCGGCGKTGIKLWRDYQTFLANQSLKCADCAAKEQCKDTSSVDSQDKYHVDIKDPKTCHTDSIGWRVPAVPTSANDTFWGYTSVPLEGYDWWCRLPLQ